MNQNKENSSMPVAGNWDRFWSLAATKKFQKVSWSKKRIMSVLIPLIQKNQKALDAGCGSGFFSKFFCDQGLATVSLDYSDEALEIAHRMTSGRSRIVKGDLLVDDLSTKISERFDVIFSDGLLEHFSNAQQDCIFKNFSALLSPGGILVTFVPNQWSPWELIRPFYMPGIDEKPFVMKELIQLSERNGFQIISSGGVNTFPFRFSPDCLVGRNLGMLLYTVSFKK
jgi:SAM-dependent methyltransferase